MRNVHFLGAICAAFLLVTSQAAAQVVLNPIVGPLGQSSTVIGPDGTYYVLAPDASSTFQSPVSDLTAIGVGATPSWSITLNARVSQVLPGATTVFVVETEVSGSGKNTTSTTSIAMVAVSTGTLSKSTISPTGNITDIEVRTISGSDYLYIYSVSTSSSTSGNTTTFTTSRTLTIYSSSGTVIKTVDNL